jgi:putative two-component system response regulator
MIEPERLREARILIVDDQQDNLDLLVDILAREGYRHLTTVVDSREAAGRFSAIRPHLVLLDINMPHLDGFGVLEQLKHLERDGLLSVLVLTSLADAPTRLRALACGAKDFLNKPFSVPEVIVRIRNMLEARLLVEQVLDYSTTLEATVQERTEELRMSQHEVVHRLALASERRDPETGAHIIRMSRACALVAAAAGWPPDEVDQMLHASPLHDVGKVGIPDAILLKPGPLTPEEWTVMRTHATIGAELLGRGTTRLMQLAQTIALSHHEWWDGTGYPAGLAGEAIPVAARICAVCDVFDAMSNDRCYHHAMDTEEVARHIRAMRGKHFDPQVVEWFDRALPEILRGRGATTPVGPVL